MSLIKGKIYLAYLLYPDELSNASPTVASAGQAETPTTPTLLHTFNAPDVSNPPFQRLRDPKYHPVLVHEWYPSDNEAVVFVCNTSPRHQHRYAPIDNAARRTNQPPDAIKLEPEGSFANRGSYINFSHPITCKVVFQSTRVRRHDPQVTPGRALTVELANPDGDVAVTVNATEKRKLLRLHWHYWNNTRYYFDPDNGGPPEGDGGSRGGGGGPRAGGSGPRGGGGGNESEGGEKGRGSDVMKGDGDCTLKPEHNAEEWSRTVAHALDNPIVPEAPEQELPKLVIVSQRPETMNWCQGDEGLDDALKYFGRRLVA